MYGLGVTSVPQTKTQVDPLVGWRSTVYSISESRVGLFGDGTDVHSMWATLGVGLVVSTDGEASVATLAAASPLPST